MIGAVSPVMCIWDMPIRITEALSVEGACV